MFTSTRGKPDVAMTRTTSSSSSTTFRNGNASSTTRNVRNCEEDDDNGVESRQNARRRTRTGVQVPETRKRNQASTRILRSSLVSASTDNSSINNSSTTSSSTNINDQVLRKIDINAFSNNDNHCSSTTTKTIFQNYHCTIELTMRTNISSCV